MLSEEEELLEDALARSRRPLAASDAVEVSADADGDGMAAGTSEEAWWPAEGSVGAIRRLGAMQILQRNLDQMSGKLGTAPGSLTSGALTRGLLFDIHSRLPSLPVTTRCEEVDLVSINLLYIYFYSIVAQALFYCCRRFNLLDNLVV